MAKQRVHEIAKEIGLTSKEVLAHLEKIGEAVKSHASSVTEDVAARVKSDLSGSPDGASATKPPAAKAPAKKGTPEAPSTKPAEAPKKTPAKTAETTQAPVPEPTVAPEGPAAQEPLEPEVPETTSEPEEQVAAADGAITVHRGITVQDFAEKVDRSPAEIVKLLIGLGEMVTVTQSMSDEAVALVGEELGTQVEVVDPTQEEVDEEEDFDEDPAELITRPPVVTVMGHVDHGKTAILDAIRKTNVAEGEAGGITQHIGAYQVHVAQRDVTFIDTPGHEAFTAMRARGAQATDIAVLVVAADDGVMPQTVEAIDHAKAARVPIVVAVNKVDKPESDPTRVRQQLSDHGLLAEEWGGDTVFVDVSAKQRTNLEGLLEMILLTADVQLEGELKTNPNAYARGVVIEAHLDKGRGPVATVLVRRGTLYDGDAFVAGAAWGRVRALLDHSGNAVDKAVPGQPVQILGWQSLPQAGDEFRSFEDEREARDIAGQREQHRREADLVSQRATSLASLLAATGKDEVPELNVLLKADTQGSVEALADQMDKLDQSLVNINVIRKGAGGITENDVTLAQASNALIIGFNVVPSAQARPLAEEVGVDIRSYRVIYQAIQDIENAAKGLLGPELKEIPIGQAEVRETFKVPRAGMVAGCMVLEGKITRNAQVRLVRDGTVIYESTIASLRRFKDDVREVTSGYECGIGIEGYQDMKNGDIIQAFEVQEVAR